MNVTSASQPSQPCMPNTSTAISPAPPAGQRKADQSALQEGFPGKIIFRDGPGSRARTHSSAAPQCRRRSATATPQPGCQVRRWRSRKRRRLWQGFREHQRRREQQQQSDKEIATVPSSNLSHSGSSVGLLRFLSSALRRPALQPVQHQQQHKAHGQHHHADGGRAGIVILLQLGDDQQGSR